MSDEKLDVAGSSCLPEPIVEAIAIANALSIGLQPAILANLALAQQILNDGVNQQQRLASQQILLQLQIAVLAKSVAAIATLDPASPETPGQVEVWVELVQKLASTPSGSAAPTPALGRPAADAGDGDQAGAGTESAADPLGPIIEALAQTSAKVVGEMPALLAGQIAQFGAQQAGLTMENAVAQQQALAALTKQVLTAALAMLGGPPAAP